MADPDETTAIVTPELNNNTTDEKNLHENEVIYPSSESQSGSSAEDSDSEYGNSTDSSDEEDARYTIGNIPMKWYEDLEHAGYNLDGKKIAKAPNLDQLDKLVEKMSNPDFWKTIQDPLS